MAFADTSTGWSLPSLAAAIAVHGALLIAAVEAFDIANDGARDRPHEVIAVFETAAPPASPPRPVEQRQAVRAPQSSTQPPPRAVGDRLPVAESSAAVIDDVPPVPVPQPVLPSQPAARPAPVPVTAPVVDPLAAYVGELRAAIMQWKPRGLRKAGEVTVAFTLSRAGGLQRARIVQSSGDVQLDQAALRMVRQAAPFAAPPAAATGLDFTIAVRFH